MIKFCLFFLAIFLAIFLLLSTKPQNSFACGACTLTSTGTCCVNGCAVTGCPSGCQCGYGTCTSGAAAGCGYAIGCGYYFNSTWVGCGSATPKPKATPTPTPAPTCGCNSTIANCCNRSCTSGGQSCTCYGVCNSGSCSTGGVVSGSCTAPTPAPCNSSNCSGPSNCVESGPTTCEQYTTACRGTPLTCTYGPHASCTGCTHSATPPPTPAPTPPPTPAPTPPPGGSPNCNTGVSCGACSVSCGGGTRSCYYYSYTGGGACNVTFAYSQSCNTQACLTPTPAPPPTYSISGNVYIDTNGNGAKDVGEASYTTGTTVSLSTGASTSTNTSGNYVFSSLNSGTYTVTLTIPSGYQATTTNPVSTSVGPSTTVNFGIQLAPTYTISGNVFNDANKNQLKDAGESNYSPITITSSSGGNISYPSSVNFNYKVSGLTAGTYTISYTSLPTGYQMTVPINGPPPAYTVTVGNPGCSVGGSNSASCDINNNIINLNFGITNSIPWIQGIGGGDIGGDGGINSGGGGGTGGTGAAGGFNDPISSTALAICGGPYASIPGNTSITPGLIFTGNGSAYFGQGSASLNNWLVGGTNYPDSFGPVSQGGLIKTSYAYLQSIAKQADITPIDLNSDASLCSFGGLTNCKLSSTIPHGIYVANGDLTLTGNGTPASYTFPSNQSYIILVHGNLTVQTQLHVPAGSTALFSASGNITVDKLVGEQNYQSSASDIEGIFSADQNFNINGQNDCTIGPDLKFNVAGSIITNAALNGGTFINQRDLCENNIYCPVFTVQSRPDFILNAPDFIKKANYTWQEVAP